MLRCFCPSTPRPQNPALILSSSVVRAHQRGQLMVCVASPLAQTLHREALPPVRDKPKRNRKPGYGICRYNFFYFAVLGWGHILVEKINVSHQTAAWPNFRIIGFIVARECNRVAWWDCACSCLLTRSFTLHTLCAPVLTQTTWVLDAS